MIVINFDEYNINRKKILSDIPKSIFIHPTDTIYGIGCNALDDKLVSKIRKLKNSEQPFSIIVPSKEWIYNNCVVTEEAEEWIRKLPGPYTLILKLKNPDAVARNVHNSKTKDITIGVRMPNHWFLAVSYTLKIPIVTTSANQNGQDYMTSLDDIDSMIRNNVDYLFYEGVKRGTPSTLVHLSNNTVKLQPRIAKTNPKKIISFPLEEIDHIHK